MANYMPEVAKMLGVELGEEFECDDGYKYVLREDGIIESKYRGDFTTNTFPTALIALLNGEMVIKRKPWKPKDDEEYWLVNQCGNVISLNWIDNFLCITNYKIGNCYRTKEEAEANRDKWVAFYTSDKVLGV